MSVAAVSWAYSVEGLSAPARSVLVALGWMADKNDECWPSQATLARMTSLTDRTVRAALASLEADGLITRTPRQRGVGRGRTSDLYTVRRRATDRKEIPDQPANRATNRKEIPDQPEGDSGGPRKEVPGKKEQKEQTVKEKLPHRFAVRDTDDEKTPEFVALLDSINAEEGPLTSGEELLIENMHAQGQPLPKITATLRKQRTA